MHNLLNLILIIFFSIIHASISLYVGSHCQSLLFHDILIVPDVIKICCVKINVGNESIFVIGIYRSADEAELPQF